MKALFCALTVFVLSAGSALAGTEQVSRCLDPQKSEALTGQFELLGWTVEPQKSPLGFWKHLDTVDLCQTDSLPYAVLKSLIFLQDSSNETIIKDEFDHDKIGGSPMSFFARRVKRLKLESADSHLCRGGTAAFVMWGEELKHELHVCPYVTQFSALLTASVLMHESRHIEGYPHALCAGGMYDGTASCDPSYEFGGSYAVGTEVMVKTARSQTASAIVRQEARGEAVAELLVRFIKAPLGIQPGALLLSEDGVLSFFDGRQEQPLIKDIPVTTKVVMREVPALFNTLDGSVRGFSAGPALHEVRGPLAADFRALPTERQRRLVDAFYGSVNCLLFEDSIRCVQDLNQLDWPLPPQLRPLKLRSVQGASGKSLSIVDQNGDIWLLPNTTDIRKWNPEQLMRSEFGQPAWIKSLLSFRDLKLALSLDGTLLQDTDPGVGWTLHDDFQGRKFRDLMGPFYWSFRMQEL